MNLVSPYTARVRLVLVGLLLSSALGALGCRGEQAPPAQSAPVTAASGEVPRPTSKTGEALVQFMRDSPHDVVIGKAEGARGLGGTNVTVDGRDVWPPSGDRCPALVQCCTDLAAAAATTQFGLACQLAVVREPACKDSLATVAALLREQALETPATQKSCPVQ